MAVNGMAILECRKWQSSILGTGRVAVAYRASVRIALEAVTVSSTAQCAVRTHSFSPARLFVH